MARDKRLTLEQSQLISRVRTMGLATAIPIFLEDSELARLAAIILNDVGQEDLIPKVIHISSSTGYYDLPLEWFTSGIEGIDFISIYLVCIQNVQDFDTYFS